MEDGPVISECHLCFNFLTQATMTFPTVTLPPLDDVAEWLGPSEQMELELWRSPDRRLDWLRGRWLAKTMLCRWLPFDSISPRELEILSRNPTTGRGVAPRVLIRGKLLSRSLSLAHTEGSVAIALAKESRVRVGIDLVRRQPAASGFVRTWFTESEQQHFKSAGPDEPIRFWAAKEALFKTLSEERFLPKQWELTRLSPHLIQCQSPIHHRSESVRVRDWQVGDFMAALAMREAGP